ncbi:AAR178Cp [Eremothecium gossypii ATCC 10895]|uniref:AAR178Cp n=1 Tax=Eremothecium gossypii (strain ATCC 10895 / CBS 109.51 / FGSC 9923 / NRRL Y-1056) TaxID=284811 RepID=Q75E99_EREGS|nr:AAR178Cp [Eremothecium gossypii ATCC 10895]AAS50545.1 AAR178Cp [Eremothecium gossypii ATCC 10895]AEY94832.1 FAAR178Cp [Eremothecium gossypii FDAG1]
MSAIQDDISGSLKTVVAEKLKTLQNFSEDVNYVAEYIVLLLSNGGTHDSVLQELVGLFDSVPQQALADVVQTSFQALQLLRSGDNIETVYQKLTNPGMMAPEPPAEAMSVSAPSEPSVSTEATSMPRSAFEGMVDLSASKYATKNPTSSRGGLKRGGKQGGINKSASGPRKGNQQTGGKHRMNALARALGMEGEDAANNAQVNIIPKKEGRCQLFPRCPLGKFCPHAHPTKVCRDYPNCPNAPGTCEYLHPNEDVELMKEIEKTREEFREKRIALAQSRAKPIQTGIVLCKFGIMCSNPMCPFGHPTPANEDAKVIQFIWCPQNLTCDKKDCDKAHSSLSKIRDVQPIAAAPRPSKPAAFAPAERSLEQCKFGVKCTNKRCKYRHARSHIMCREGAACTRIDCFFGHPINEPCKFGAECRNAHCLFQHPPGRSLPDKSQAATGAPSWPAHAAGGNQSANERPYAVAESAGIEQAPIQESDGDATMA